MKSPIRSEETPSTNAHTMNLPPSSFFAIPEILRDILANPLTEEGVFYLIMSTAYHDARLHHPQQC
jgi:hypothetical protein